MQQRSADRVQPQAGMITGHAASRKVWFGARPLLPGPSQKVWNHSPAGFSWGYGGSAPAQLALAILLRLTDVRTAVAMHQRCKRAFLARLNNGSDFTLPIATIQDWLTQHREERSL